MRRYLARINVETKLGTPEVWEIVSLGMAHPFYVHGASFRVLSLEGPYRPLIWRVGKTLFSSRARPSFWLHLVTRDAGASLHVSLSHPRTRGCRVDGAICVRLSGRRRGRFACKHWASFQSYSLRSRRLSVFKADYHGNGETTDSQRRLGLGIGDQSRKALVHVVLMMAVEQCVARIVGHKIDLRRGIARHADRVLHQP